MGSVPLTVMLHVGNSVASSATAMLRRHINMFHKRKQWKRKYVQARVEALDTVLYEFTAGIIEGRLGDGVVLLVAKEE